ncbi:right-handed parallel beta-helix repeat-containing protein [Candidatus Daviesbacteria bacterium]|nr:right-handed parallel beta-helix repeat-containing protein [Candidatus Daviesbacteria bacterium]
MGFIRKNIIYPSLLSLIIIFFAVQSKEVRAADCALSNIRFASSSNTIYLSGPITCSLSQLKALKSSLPLYLVDASSKTWLLKANLKLEDGATLNLYGTSIGGDVNYLRLKSNNSSSANSIVWIRADWGNINIKNTKITSWDEAKKSPDTEYGKYKRSFIHVRSFLASDGITPKESRMDIIDSEVGYLGYYAAESYGLAWKVSGSGPNLYDKVNVYGDVINSHIHHNYFGMYTFGADAMKIQNNEVDTNVMYGIDPHDDSDNLLIEGNRTHHNGTHGIICSQRCNNLTIRNNKSYENKGTGIMLHRNTNDSLVENNDLFGNSDSGIAIFDSHENIIRGNISHDNKNGIRFSVGSSGNTTELNEFSENDGYGLYFYKGSDAPTSGTGRITGNKFIKNKVIDNGDYAVKLKEADLNIFEQNEFKGNSREINISDSNQNIFLGNLSDSFYNASLKAKNTIKDTDSALVKVSDSASSMEVLSSSNFIFQNDKSLPTSAENSKTYINLTRALTSSTVNFKRLNFKVKPAADKVDVTVLTWETSNSFGKKWKEKATSSVTVDYEVSDLKPDTKVDVLINGNVFNSFTSDSSGKINFTYDGNVLERTFEVKES